MVSPPNKALNAPNKNNDNVRSGVQQNELIAVHAWGWTDVAKVYRIMSGTMSVQETPLGRLHNSRYNAVRNTIVYAPVSAKERVSAGQAHEGTCLNPPNKYVSSHRAMRYALSNGILYIMPESPAERSL